MLMRILVLIFGLVFLIFTGCDSDSKEMKKVIFLHHSTGYNIWVGGTNRYLYKLTKKGDVQKYIDRYNRKNNTNYSVTEQYFPKENPYGWNNYPYDYYNIWVKNAGSSLYMDEPTLEILTKEYDVIIFKHCFPGSRILEDTGMPDIESDVKRLENYKLQYNALKRKMHEFPDNKFIVWTPAVNTRSQMTEGEASRTADFHKWLTEEWNENGDNIYLWDFYKYETEGDLYLPEKNAYQPDNSHPNKEFSARIAPIFGKFIIEVLESGTL